MSPHGTVVPTVALPPPLISYTCSDRYALMTEYSVTVPDPDVASVRMMETSLGQVTHLVAQVEASQEERTNQFTDDIETSIASLRTASDELRAESEDKMLFDGNTDMIEALGKLDYLDSSFQALKADSERFAHFQEILKVPVTRCAALTAAPQKAVFLILLRRLPCRAR